MAALLVIALSAGAVVVAAHSNPSKIVPPVDVKNLKVGPAAPPLDAKGWINSPPLTPTDLRGKVVLYDFWTYSCINCVRTFPYVRSWFDRYRADGLVVVGVHSPEFDFEKVHANVQAAVQRDRVTWPVALDDGMKIWNEFANQYWPADYIADRTGHIRYSHFGEGLYAETENVIRELLGVPASSPRAGPVHADSASGQQVNPETYLGLQYQPQPSPVHVGTYDYPSPAPGAIAAPSFALVGRWTAGPESIRADASAATILLGVHAQQVNLVLASPSGKRLEVFVELDGRPVPRADRGSSIHEDANGRTFVTVDAPDMYRLVASARVGDHTLSVTAASPGLEAYDFTFG